MAKRAGSGTKGAKGGGNKGGPAAKAEEKPAAKAVEQPPAKAEDKPAAEQPPAKAEDKPAAAPPAPPKPVAKAPNAGAPRHDERWDLSHQDITYKVGDVVKQGRMRDVSDSGCRIEHTNDQPRVGAIVDLEIPGRFGPLGRLRVRGSVRWAKPGRDELKQFGVSFTRGQDEAIRKLVYRTLVSD